MERYFFSAYDTVFRIKPTFTFCKFKPVIYPVPVIYN
jgi:hypothetical protein